MGCYYFFKLRSLTNLLKRSLRSKRFRRAFRQVWSIFRFLSARKLGRAQKMTRRGRGRGKGNACPQTPRFWKSCSSTNGVSWLERHGSVDCQVINPSIKSGLFSWAWPAWIQRTGSALGAFFSLLLFLPRFLSELLFIYYYYYFCPDPTADLKDLRQAFSDTEESTRTFLPQGLLPDRDWSSRLHKLMDCSGAVWETADSLPIGLRITSNNAPSFRIFRAQESHRQTVGK